MWINGGGIIRKTRPEAKEITPSVHRTPSLQGFPFHAPMFRHYREAFIRLFYPAACEVCHTNLDLEEKILCQHCAGDLDSLAWPMEKAMADERFEHLDHIWTVLWFTGQRVAARGQVRTQRLSSQDLPKTRRQTCAGRHLRFLVRCHLAYTDRSHETHEKTF